MQELLTLARQLRPTALDDLGLEAALAGNVRELARQGVSRPASRLDGSSGSIPGDVQLVVYRVAQEALTNAARHSGAEHVRVGLGRARRQGRARVADDGRGFSFDEAAAASGSRACASARCSSAGKFRSSRGRAGTRIRLGVPILKAIARGDGGLTTCGS